MRLIDADALSETMRDRYDMLVKDYGQYDAYAEGYDEAITLIEATETIEAQEVKHGKWIPCVAFRVKCSRCSVEIKDEDGYIKLGKYPYCPNCGARMDGDKR